MHLQKLELLVHANLQPGGTFNTGRSTECRSAGVTLTPACNQVHCRAQCCPGRGWCAVFKTLPEALICMASGNPPKDCGRASMPIVWGLLWLESPSVAPRRDHSLIPWRIPWWVMQGCRDPYAGEGPSCSLLVCRLEPGICARELLISYVPLASGLNLGCLFTCVCFTPL